MLVDVQRRVRKQREYKRFVAQQVMKPVHRTVEEQRQFALVWGGWHDHQCIDCGATYACTVAHGTEGVTATRCDVCFDQKYN